MTERRGITRDGEKCGLAPPRMMELQQWMGGLIQRPLSESGNILPLTPRNAPIEQEASHYVAPSPTLAPYQRIEIYNQQYWYRLLSCLQETFPLTLRLFGHHSFNQELAVPYLMRYPPHHWSLNRLGDQLPMWVRHHYHKSDQEVVRLAIDIDWGYNWSFVAARLPSLADQPLSPEELYHQRLYLQPHLFLISGSRNLLDFRRRFLEQDVDYWIDHPFPTLEGSQTYHYAIWRNQHNLVSWCGLSPLAFSLLSLLDKGETLDACLDLLLDSGAETELTAHLAEWLHTWSLRNWLTLQEPTHSQLAPLEPNPPSGLTPGSLESA